MADIESMFHQVRIPDFDADSLRFLWWKGKFNSEVINIGKRHFYVDDCLKSCPAVSSAIPLVEDLHDLLMRGSFHLSK